MLLPAYSTAFMNFALLIVHIVFLTKHFLKRRKQKTSENEVKSALKIFNPKKVVEKIEEFLAHPEELEPLRLAAEAQHDNYGPEQCARYIFELLCTRFPQLKNN